MNQEFYSWRKESLQPIEIVPYKTLPIAKQIEEGLQRGTLKNEPQKCFNNSFWAAMTIPGVTYIEGYFKEVAEFEHAWCCYQGQYFDLTVEDEYAYLKKIELNRDELLSFAKELKISGPFLFHYFKKMA